MNSKVNAIARVMAAYNYKLIRAKRHAIWQHRLTGHRIVTAMTPSDHNALINITCRAKRGSQPHHPPTQTMVDCYPTRGVCMDTPDAQATRAVTAKGAHTTMAKHTPKKMGY